MMFSLKSFFYFFKNILKCAISWILIANWVSLYLKKGQMADFRPLAQYNVLSRPRPLK